MIGQLYMVHAYEVNCPTMLEMSYVLLPQHTHTKKTLFHMTLGVCQLTSADNCIVGQKLIFIVLGLIFYCFIL